MVATIPWLFGTMKVHSLNEKPNLGEEEETSAASKYAPPPALTPDPTESYPYGSLPDTVPVEYKVTLSTIGILAAFVPLRTLIA